LFLFLSLSFSQLPMASLSSASDVCNNFFSPSSFRLLFCLQFINPRNRQKIKQSLNDHVSSVFFVVSTTFAYVFIIRQLIKIGMEIWNNQNCNYAIALLAGPKIPGQPVIPLFCNLLTASRPSKLYTRHSGIIISGHSNLSFNWQWKNWRKEKK
jgi:hypothetical protein